MPTADEIREYREWRAKIINGIWDAEAADTTSWVPGVHTREILSAIGADRLPKHFISRLINDLVEHGLVQGQMMVDEETHPTTVKLTSYGRMEVERWIETDEPTALLPVKPSLVLNTTNTHFHGPVTGSAVTIGSSGTTINMQTAVGEKMSTLVEKARELLATWDGHGDAREEVEADIGLLDESRDDASSLSRMKPALRRIAAWATSAAAVGASAGLSEQVHELTGQVLSLL